MDKRSGEIRRIENVPVEDGTPKEPWTELKPEEVQPLVNLPMAERPAALAQMRGMDMGLKGKKDRRRAEKMAARSRSKQRAHKAKRDHGRK